MAGKFQLATIRKGSMAGQRIGLIDRISLDERTGCWNWKGPVDSKFGYGKTKLNGKFISAHRLSATLWLQIDRHDPRCVLHKCDNPRCFNPKHLFMGTLSDNSKDSVAKGRQNFARRTACSKGHVYGENPIVKTRIRDGKMQRERWCRICHNERSLARYYKKKEVIQ